MKKIGDYILKGIEKTCAAFAILVMFLMIGHILLQCIPAVRRLGAEMFLPEAQWRPVSSHPQYGLLPVIAGTLYVSLLAVAIAVFFGVLTSLFMEYYVKPSLKHIFLSFVELVAGIPSVIFGFIGLTVLVKMLQEQFHAAAGQCVFAASIVLAVMLLPFIVSTCMESIERARKHYEPTALSLGMSREVTMVKIILPSIRNSVIAAVTMAFGRGLGETMAVMMVVGNSPIFPKLFGRSQTIAALTALEMGSIEYGSIHLSVLYVANFVLLVILAGILSIGSVLKRRIERNEA